MKEEIHLKTEDHPEAGGRKPNAGDTADSFRLPLESGTELVIHMGQKGFETATNLLMDMLTEAPSYNDGLTNLDRPVTHRIEGALLPIQKDRVLTAVKWLERIANRAPELPPSFMDGIDPRDVWALAESLRTLTDE